MGCDIHDYVEIRLSGTWEKVGNVFDNPYYQPDKPTEMPDESGYVWNAPKIEHPLRVRNYSAFSILAGVRNNYEFKPIALPKGLPADVTADVRKISDEWGCDGHSHSWLSLQELEDSDLLQIVEKRGVVDLKQYEVFKNEGRPASYCQWVGGPQVRAVSNNEMDKLLETPLETAEHYYTQVKWQENYAEAAGRLVTYTIPALRTLATEHGLKSEDVRIVFWFDN